MGLRGAGYRWIAKKREESRERKQWEKEAKAEAMQNYKDQYKQSLATQMKAEAMKKAKNEAKMKARESFGSGSSLMGRFEGFRAKAQSGIESFSNEFGGLPMVNDIYGTSSPRPRKTRKKKATTKKKKRRSSPRQQSNPFSLF